MRETRPEQLSRPEYLNSIDALLDMRAEAADAIEACLVDINGRVNAECVKDLAKLRAVTHAEEFLSDERVINYLPIMVALKERAPTDLHRHLRLLSYSEKKISRVRGIPISYTALVFGLSALILVLQAHFLSPVFESIFDDFEITLSSNTELVIWSNVWIRRVGPFVLFIIVLAFLAGGLVKQFVPKLQQEFIRIPLLNAFLSGRWVSLISMARLTTALAVLGKLRTPNEHAIRLAGKASQHTYYRHAADSLAPQMIKRPSGEFLDPREMRSPFPASLVSILREPLEPEQRWASLRDLSETYVDRAVMRDEKRGGGTPFWAFLIVVTLVQYCVYAMFVPLISLITALS